MILAAFLQIWILLGTLQGWAYSFDIKNQNNITHIKAVALEGEWKGYTVQKEFLISCKERTVRNTYTMLFDADNKLVEEQKEYQPTVKIHPQSFAAEAFKIWCKK
jgi:hypothetical protein